MSNQLAVANLQKNIESMADEFTKAIPPSLQDELDSDRFIRIALTTIKSTPALLKCSPASIYKSLTEACQLGLVVDGVLGHAYLVPYKNVCTLIPGYKGLKNLVRNTGKVRNFKTGCVYKGDEFYWQAVPFEFRHVHGDSTRVDDADITHVYMWWELTNGACDAKVWTGERARKFQGKHGGSSPAWKSSFPKMSEKSVCKDAINSGDMPTSAAVQLISLRAAEYDRETTISSPVVTNKPTELNQLENKFAPPVDAIESSVIVEKATSPEDSTPLEEAVFACKACENTDDLLAVQKKFEGGLDTADQFELNQVCEEHAKALN